MSHELSDQVALACDTPEPWFGKRAPSHLKTYPAWSADPTRTYLDTPMERDERPRIRVPWLGLCILLLAMGALVAAWLSWVR